MHTPPANKMLPLEELATIREEYRKLGKRVVWTNGCYDVFHAGHVLSLHAARNLGDILIVGLNSDASVKSLKGARRPYCPAEQRATVLSALESVDHIIAFDGKRCTPELEVIQPDIYAKGADYTLETIDQAERAAVENGGGTVAFLPLIQGLSTTHLLKAIRRSDPEKIISAAFALLRDETGRLLMVGSQYTEGLRWGLPGGGQNRGETLEETVIRECREETGLDVRVRCHKGVIERIEPAIDLHLVLHLFEVDITGGALTIDPNEENVVDAAFLTRDELANHSGWVLGRHHFLQYMDDPEGFPPYIFMGPGEE